MTSVNKIAFGSQDEGITGAFESLVLSGDDFGPTYDSHSDPNEPYNGELDDPAREYELEHQKSGPIEAENFNDWIEDDKDLSQESFYSQSQPDIAETGTSPPLAPLNPQSSLQLLQKQFRNDVITSFQNGKFHELQNAHVKFNKPGKMDQPESYLVRDILIFSPHV